MKIKKNILLPFLLIGAFLFSATQAQAAVITIETDKLQYQVGEKVTAFINLSDTNSLISGFFLALHYQNSALALDSWSYGHAFDDGLGSYQFGDHDVANSRLALEDYADWAADQAILAALQFGSFRLATVEFTALSAGQFNLGFDPAYFGLLTFAGDLFEPDWQNASFDVVANPNAVPATPVMALMLGGLLLLGGQRRQQQRTIQKAVAA